MTRADWRLYMGPYVVESERWTPGRGHLSELLAVWLAGRHGAPLLRHRGRPPRDRSTYIDRLRVTAMGEGPFWCRSCRLYHIETQTDRIESPDAHDPHFPLGRARTAYYTLVREP